MKFIKKYTWQIITAVMALALIAVSIPLGIYISKFNNYNSIPLKIDESDVTNNFLLEDAEEKANNENVSVFYFQSYGAFIFEQMFVDILLQQQINPEKEIVLAFNDKSSPWATNWSGEIDYDLLGGVQIMESGGGNNAPINNDKINYLFENDYVDEGQGIDLYTNNYAYFTANKQDEELIDNMGDSLKTLDSWTVFTDGTYQFRVEDEAIKTYKKYSQIDLLLAESIIEDLYNGTKSSNDFSRNDKKIASMLFPITKTSLDVNFIGLTGDVYKERKNIFASSTSGFESAINYLSNESMDKLINIVGLEEYQSSDMKMNQVGKNNFVISGRGHLDSDPEVITEGDSIIKTYNEILDSGIDNFNVMYKPHPVSSQAYLDKIYDYVSDETGTDSTTWLQIIPKDIQYEFYVMTGQFNDDESNGTTYKQYLTANSTVVPALYDCGIKSDSVEKYYFSSQEDIDTVFGWYGNTGIIDWDKAEIL